jgi:hypothetical protein
MKEYMRFIRCSLEAISSCRTRLVISSIFSLFFPTILIKLVSRFSIDSVSLSKWKLLSLRHRGDGLRFFLRIGWFGAQKPYSLGDNFCDINTFTFLIIIVPGLDPSCHSNDRTFPAIVGSIFGCFTPECTMDKVCIKIPACIFVMPVHCKCDI